MSTRVARVADHLWEYGNDPLQFSPYDIAVDEARNLVYVSDSVNRRVHVLAADRGTFLRYVEDHRHDEARLLGPRGLDVDGQGNLYICDSINSSVEVYDSSGRHVRHIGMPQLPSISPWSTPSPSDVAVKRDGTEVWVGDTNNFLLWIFDGNGVLQRYIRMPMIDKPGNLYLKLSPTGDLVLSGRTDGRGWIYTFPGEGSLLRTRELTHFCLGAGSCVDPRGFDFDKEGNLLIVDRRSGIIDAFLPDGRYVYTLTGDHQPLPFYMFASSVTITTDNIVFVAASPTRAFRMLGSPPAAQGISQEEVIPLSLINQTVGSFEAVVLPDGVHLDWEPVEGADGYTIQRTERRHAWPVALTKAEHHSREHHYLDKDVLPGFLYHYRVSVSKGYYEGPMSQPRTVTPPSETVPCEAPQWNRVVCREYSEFGRRQYRVLLAAKPCREAMQYNLYRKLPSERSFALSNPSTESVFVDDQVSLGQRYLYVVSTESSSFKESQFSKEVEVTVAPDVCKVPMSKTQ